MRFSVITPTLQRESLIKCCQSLDRQTFEDWEHIVVIDGEMNPECTRKLSPWKRTILSLGSRVNDFGNTPRHVGWKWAKGDYVIYLDDDNFFAHPKALEDIARTIQDEDIAFFPILRFDQFFLSDNPRCCHVDTANMVIRREIAQWPKRPEYTMDGIFCEELKAGRKWAVHVTTPIIIVPVQSKGI